MPTTSLNRTQIYIGGFDTLPESLKITSRLYLDPTTNVLARWDGSAMQPVISKVFYATTVEGLPTTATQGCIGVVATGDSTSLYAHNGTAWVQVGGSGSGSIELVANKEALPEDAKAGDVAITTDLNVLYYYSGTDWIATEERINIPYVYNPMGDFKEGEVITNMPPQKMWEKLLTKEINPVITQPSVSFSMSGASNNSLQEIGAQLNLTFTANFNQGNVRDNWGSKDLQSSTYSGVPNTYTFTGTGLTPSVSSTALSNQQTVNPYKVVAGAQTWTASVTYDAGTYQPKTNRENAYSSPCPAGTKTGGTLKLTGVYPTFATSTALGTATKQALKEEPANGSAYITFTLAGESSPDQRQFFELPKSWSALTGVADSGGAWYNGGKSGSLLQWTMTEVNETVQGEEVPYRRYTYNGPLSAIRTIRVFTK